MFPRKKNAFLSGTRGRENSPFLWYNERGSWERFTGASTIYDVNISATERGVRDGGLHGSASINSQGQIISRNTTFWDSANRIYDGAQSIWPLDARLSFGKTPEQAALSVRDGERSLFLNADEVNFAHNVARRRWQSSEDGHTGFNGEGELQNDYCLYHNGFHVSIPPGSNRGTAMSLSGGLRPAALYARRVPESAGGGLTSTVTLAGDTKWEAATQAAKRDGKGNLIQGPFYQNIEDYYEDLRAQGKDHSIIPEFRISEHMKHYVKDQGGNFLADNVNMFTLTGSAISSSNDNNFYSVLSTTDFLKKFSIIRDDHEGYVKSESGNNIPSGNPSKIRLSCKALMKFMPYDGFYPVQRTVQLATLFSQSYGNYVTSSGNSGSFRTALTPFMAPGILYNSIKSGVAVDYPIKTEDNGWALVNQENNLGTAGPHAGQSHGRPALSGTFDSRLDFTALLRPDIAVGGQEIIDSEPHVSATIDSTSSFIGVGDPLYTMAMHNFLAEVPSFYLKHGNLTTINSKPDVDDGQNFVVESVPGETTPKQYRMRVVMSHAENRSIGTLLAKTDGTTVSNYTTRFWNPPTFTMYERTGSGIPKKGAGSYDSYVYGSSFGPAFHISVPGPLSNFWEFSPTASYSPFTPPYYNGYSHAEFVFQPTRLGYHSLPDVLEKTTIKYFRLIDWYNGFLSQSVTAGDVGDFVTNADYGSIPVKTMDASDSEKVKCSAVGGAEAMQISASMNLLTTVKEPIVSYNSDGTPDRVQDSTEGPNRWVLQTKWECPVLDFSNAPVSLPISGSGSVSKGMWHQYGQTMKNDQGIYIEIQDVDNSSAMVGGPLDIGRTGSLADLVGFAKEPVNPYRIGDIADERIVSEAIVAMPFVRDVDGNMNFYKIDSELIKLAKENPAAISHTSPEIVELVHKMDRFVIPPKFDFMTNSTVDPNVMYIFEFQHTFTKKDLADMWQNLPPDSLLSVKEPKESQVTITHDLMPSDFFGVNEANGPSTNLQAETQWLVFKVKQKAEKNYYATTADIPDDSRFKFNFEFGGEGAEKESVPDYSFNWPYDFFSMVELATLDAGITFEAPGGITETEDNTADV